MKQIKIGNSNWKASAVALGIMRMEALSVPDAAKTIEAAYDSGINYIDSADIYGMGNSETVFGKALKESGISRDKLFIQSKGGIVFDKERSHGSFVFGKRYDFSKDHLIDAVDGILERMQVDYLDSFLLHRPDPLMEPEEVAAAFDELQTAGKVRHFGVSNFNTQQFMMMQEAVDQKLLMNQLQFSIMHTGMVDSGIHTNMTDPRSIDHDGGILEFSRRKGITIQTWSPFQYGMFEGTFIGSDKFPELNKKLQELADKYKVSKNAIATAWILKHPANMQVVIGTMNPEHIKDSADGSNVELTKQEWYDVYFAAGNDLP
ncbi:aldo/keto reductase [Companilactobacillus mishanensis]|uniref:Aldo/keto reductase n=1 Tax=Companilactobacillus mishanensis TaxID=2486008 RepID=A0A5P0ZGH5_9LACO|nr:aldo/keto reductase [Companilactobacillus mishanensis]MQS52118.1 aldo/keto reductase [Companilactobacillus mishanensis]